jgi:hypothetical protein
MNVHTEGLFRCECCREDHDSKEASLDVDLGMVCEDCRKNIRNGMAWLRRCVGAVRPLTSNDVNDSNYKRFMP